MASKKGTKVANKSPSPQANKKQSSPGGIWPPTKCTPLCSSGCQNAGKHHELIMSLVKVANTSDLEKTDFKKALDKFNKTKWLRDDCVPDKNDKIRFPLVHWACMLGKYRLLEFLIREKGFQLTVKVGKNKEGPLFSTAQHLNRGVSPKCSKDYIGNLFGNVVDVFLKYMPEALSAKETSNDDTILHFCARQCCSDPYSRIYLNILLRKIKESDKFSTEKEEAILAAVNKKGDSFLHLMVADEGSTDTLTYFFGNFGSTSESISKAKNNVGKTPRQIAVEKRSFSMLKALGAPDIVINSLKKAVKVPNHTPRNSARKSCPPQKDKVAPKSAAKPSSHVNGVSNDKENQNSKTSSNRVQSPAQDTKSASPGEKQNVELNSSDHLHAEDLKLCSCDPPAEATEQPTDCNTPSKRLIEPFPQRFPGRTPEKPTVTTENSASDVTASVAEQQEMDVENVDCTPDLPGDKETDAKPSDRNVFFSLANSISSFTNGDASSSKKRPAPVSGRARGPNRKRGRMAMDMSSDSESDGEEDADFALDDDSDDDIESAEEDEEEEDDDVEEELEEEKEENNDVGDDQQEEAEARNLEEPEAEMEAAPKHTPFCGSNCSSQHHKLLLSLLKCSNYNYGAAYVDSFMKQVNEYVNQLGKFSDVRANEDLPDPVDSFKYPLVHWVCVLGKFKVLEKLSAMKEFNLGVQSKRTGETGLHRMLFSLDRAMVRKKSPTKTILEVFSKTMKTLTNNLPSVITVCNNDGDTPFHCLAKVILDCTGELERMNTYQGYFETLVKELTRLKTSRKLTPEIVRELLLKANNSQETFLHILACRHGVGQRVIKSVLKNIDPEIMDVLKETVNAYGKTPSDLAEDLCSYEMAAILRPRDQDAAIVDGNDEPMDGSDDPVGPDNEDPVDGNDVDPVDGHNEDPVDEHPQTPERSVSAPPESPDFVNSPPATLFHPMEYAMSPYVPDGASARVRLFSVKKEPTEGGPVAEPSRESPIIVNDSPCPSVISDHSPRLPVVKTSPGKATSTSPPPADQDMDVAASSSANGSTENITTASTANHIKATTSASSVVAANQNKNGNGEPSIMSGILTMPQSDKKNFLNSLQAKFQEELVQAQRGLGEKEDALAQVRQRITDAKERKRKLLEELEETWDDMTQATRDEGVINAEIAAKKRDVERFKAELTKYETLSSSI